MTKQLNLKGKSFVSMVMTESGAKEQVIKEYNGTDEGMEKVEVPKNKSFSERLKDKIGRL